MSYLNIHDDVVLHASFKNKHITFIFIVIAETLDLRDEQPLWNYVYAIASDYRTVPDKGSLQHSQPA